MEKQKAQKLLEKSLDKSSTYFFESMHYADQMYEDFALALQDIFEGVTGDEIEETRKMCVSVTKEFLEKFSKKAARYFDESYAGIIETTAEEAEG